MKKIFFFACGLLLFACGNNNNTPSSKADPSELLKTDKEFSKMSEEKGMKEAFLFYAADEVVKLQPREFPAIGKEALKKALEQDLEGPPPVLTWEPVKADIAASGDLGYTYGNYKMTLKDSSGTGSTYYGNYVSIWKKMSDGSWKYVLDGGNSTPDPTKKDNP